MLIYRRVIIIIWNGIYNQQCDIRIDSTMLDTPKQPFLWENDAEACDFFGGLISEKNKKDSSVDMVPKFPAWQ